MKTFYKISNLGNLLLLLFIFSLGVSCKDQKNQENQLEDDKSFAGSSKRDDLCMLINQDDIRSVFALSDEIEIEQSERKSASCSYQWKIAGEKNLYYSVMLNFASGEKRTKNQIDAAWKSQNESVYAKKNMQKVAGVGDQATWSELGGAQLRVTADGYIFYVSISVIPGAKKLLPTQELIDKASTMAKIVIDRM